MTAVTSARSTLRVWWRLGTLAEHAILGVAAFAVVAPFLWMLATSFKPSAEIFDEPLRLIPTSFTAAEHYSQALTLVPLLRFMLNGLVVVTGILVVQVATATFCAYALAKLEFKGRDLLFALVVVGLCIPIQVPALPLFVAFAELRILDTYLALMAPFFVSVFAIFLFRQFFKGFPDEIIQAARLDGFTETEIVLRLVLPSARPAIAAFAVFSITAHWNDLYWPLIVISSLDLATPPLGMLFFTDREFGTSYGPLMAGATIITLPLLIVFSVAQRQFIRGITMTGFR
jgi:multiple sugar transport system permease protein